MKLSNPRLVERQEITFRNINGLVFLGKSTPETMGIFP